MDGMDLQHFSGYTLVMLESLNPPQQEKTATKNMEILSPYLVIRHTDLKIRGPKTHIAS